MVCANCHEPSKSTLTTQQMLMWIPTETDANNVMSTEGKSSPVGGKPPVGVGKGGNGFIEKPTAAVSVSEALANPPNTSTDAWPVRIAISVTVDPVMSRRAAI